MPRHPLALVDVFADAPLSGNPLAVVLDGDDLPDATLRRIAGELNQSETTFVLAPRRPGADRRLRSFTASGAEVVGAGHNALGAWWWLAATGAVAAGPLRQELGEEVLDLRVVADGDRLVVELEQGHPQLGAELWARTLAAPLGLPLDALVDGPAQVVSTGSPHLLVPARDEAAVDAAGPDAPALAAALAAVGAQGCYLYAPSDSGSGALAYARFFNPTVGLWEDPATGSAAGPLAWWLTRPAAADAPPVVIEQGRFLGRASRIAVRVREDRVTLLGSAVLTAEGHLHTDPQEQE